MDNYNFIIFIFLNLKSMIAILQLIRGIVDEALLKYSADKIGLPDFALESSGKRL